MDSRYKGAAAKFKSHARVESRNLTRALIAKFNKIPSTCEITRPPLNSKNRTDTAKLIRRDYRPSDLSITLIGEREKERERKRATKGQASSLEPARSYRELPLFFVASFRDLTPGSA